MNDDWPLLERFAREGAQDAFAALVTRHLNLVYSAARRQTGSRELAEEVAQSVFLELARQAPRLRPDQPLAAWLHVVTRRTAINAVRDETRRRAREQAAAELSAMNPNPSAWIQVEPLLDEAVAALPETDRSAILLRFFEQKSLRDIGTALGTTEDAAQKRVSRALDQLRTLLAKRGVAVTAAGLATDLSAHAIETAPLTLVAAISAGSFLTTTTGVAALEATKTVAMTTIQKTTLVAALALIAGTASYEARALQVESADRQRNAGEIQQLQDRMELGRQQQAATQRQLESVRQEIARVKTSGLTQVPIDPAMEKEMQVRIGQIGILKQAFADNPQSRIPELDLLTESDWLAALQVQQPTTPEKTRQVLARTRTLAKSKVRMTLMRAWAAYLQEHNIGPPTIQELEPYFAAPLSHEILTRYDVRPAANSGSATPQIWIQEKPVPADIEFDTYYSMAPANGGGSYNYTDVPALKYHAQQAQEAYQRAHDGQSATEPVQLLPYLPQAVDPAKLKPYMKP